MRFFCFVPAEPDATALDDKAKIDELVKAHSPEFFVRQGRNAPLNVIPAEGAYMGLLASENTHRPEGCPGPLRTSLPEGPRDGPWRVE